MNRLHSPMMEVNMVAKLADLKAEHYRNTLLLTAMMDLMIEKGLISREELEKKMADLDRVIIPDRSYPIS
jgi:hypothetical protein